VGGEPFGGIGRCGGIVRAWCDGHGALPAAWISNLQVASATMAYLDKRGVEVHVLETRDAVKIYNELPE
jgi:hypothetical protein